MRILGNSFDQDEQKRQVFTIYPSINHQLIAEPKYYNLLSGHPRGFW